MYLILSEIKKNYIAKYKDFKPQFDLFFNGFYLKSARSVLPDLA